MWKHSLINWFISRNKIHLLLTELLIQELKVVHLFSQDKYKDVVTLSILLPGNQVSLQTPHNVKHKVEARDWYNYLRKLGVQTTWDDVQFLIRRFLYESNFFRVKNPLRWDWKELACDSEDTHFESFDDIRTAPVTTKKVSSINKYIFRKRKTVRNGISQKEKRKRSSTNFIHIKKNRRKGSKSLLPDIDLKDQNHSLVKRKIRRNWIVCLTASLIPKVIIKL